MDTAVLRNRYPWNKGIFGQKRPLHPKNVWIRVPLEMSGAIRDLALFNLASIASFMLVMTSSS
jgi:hypothetical protein